MRFSLVKEEYFPTEASYYKDSAYLNMYGAKLFSELFSKIVKQELSYDDVCYKSSKERIDNDTPRVLGIVSDGVNKRIITTYDYSCDYSISVTASEGNEYQIQEYSPNKAFCVNEGERGTIHIKSKDENEKECIYDYNY